MQKKQLGFSTVYVKYLNYMPYTYQLNYSEKESNTHDEIGRTQKALKILSILNDYLKNENIKQMSLLDVGSSTGYITNILSKNFSNTIGIDIDEKGVHFAQNFFLNENLTFLNQDSMNIQFPDNTFDVVNCTHIYEHVPDSKRLMSEIYRVLKPEGVCFFTAGNRINFMEPHYKLPLLSLLPKFIAHKYVKLFKKADFYYETHLTYWGLKKLVSDFEVIDYTIKIIREPNKYNAIEMIKDGSLTQKSYLLILKMAYWLSPTYVWLLKKSLPK